MPSDYHRIEQAIHWLAEHADEQPELIDLAGFLRLSTYHTQRLFSRWAGVTPKQFLQYLTVGYAKQLLDESMSVLDVSQEVGLSGPGRLHDQMINIEAASPGEYKQGGRGLTIQFGFHVTPFGECLIASTSRGVCHLVFVEQGDHELALEGLKSLWTNADFEENAQQTSLLVKQAFTLEGDKRQGIKLLVRGTNFQVKVWQALLNIPQGYALTYGNIATWIGSPNASRAVGSAIGKNPVAYLIPCHRVIRGSGIIGEYRWGSDRKRAMIAWEAAHRQQG
ncbi:MAG: bifunctional helix-turn-helix domain-containing protein/methylated-DNA--[protein]-cysteine S-methyltransferase [Candidatus Sedimenticola sp. (ex Thyasira tokunagai)]